MLFLLILRYTIFATHMENLSELATLYPNVKILHFHVDIRNNRLDFKVTIWDISKITYLFTCIFLWLKKKLDSSFQFQLKDGPRHIPHYGLLLAGVAGLPNPVIETASVITSRLLEQVRHIIVYWFPPLSRNNGFCFSILLIYAGS